jgi:ABC-type transport system involved in multi-copper enzyme maturation permease subunit
MGNVWAVFLFEWRRALTASRIAWWVALATFPLILSILIETTVREPIPTEPWAVFLFALIPMVLSMLGTFLLTTTAVSAELERQSWIYLAVRPKGRTAVVLGKYLMAVTWVLPAALLAVTLVMPVISIESQFQIWWTIVRLSLLACPAYAAVYLFIGTIFSKRSMVVAVTYSLIFELIVSFVPAIINKFTVQYRLRSLLVDWADIMPLNQGRPFQGLDLIGVAPAWQHVCLLWGYTALLLVAAILLVRFREYASTESGDA